jgi:hypothetical protein
MKKLIKKVLIGSFLICTSVMMLSFNNSNEIVHKKQDQPTDCRYGQCNATAASTGNRCLHCVSNAGDSYCWQHK